MKNRSLQLTLALACAGTLLGACIGPTVKVTPQEPAPRALAPRPVTTVHIVKTQPEGGIVVYNIDASGASRTERQAAVHQKAAKLGCDGIVVPAKPTADALTAVCYVLPAKAEPASPAAPAVAAP